MEPSYLPSVSQDRPVEGQVPPAPRTVRATVLVVEDNAIVRKMTSLFLNNAGYESILTANGRQAIDFLRGSSRLPDIILLDMLMPVQDGWHFLEELRLFSKPLNIPIIVTTGTILTYEWALDHGCTGFLRKPYSEQELLDEVQRCLELR